MQVLFEFGSGMLGLLENQWNEHLAVDLKVTAGLSDEQMDEMRRLFTLERRTNQRQGVRVWVQFPLLGQTLHFPSPIVPRSKWKVVFDQLCDKHKISQVDGGKVAEVGCEAGLITCIQRNIALAPEGAGMSRDWPLRPTAAFDAVSWDHRKVCLSIPTPTPPPGPHLALTGLSRNPSGNKVVLCISRFRKFSQKLGSLARYSHTPKDFLHPQRGTSSGRT